MARVDEIGEQDRWRCWLCDQPVDRDMSVNDDRGPSVDARMTDQKAKKKAKKKGKTTGTTKGSGDLSERLAHRGCNTGKGKVDAVIPWSPDLFVIDPVEILPTVERLVSHGGREIFCRCPSAQDAKDTAAWLLDRISRLQPDVAPTSDIQEGAGQYLVALRA